MLTYTIKSDRTLVYKVNTGSKGEAATVEIGQVSVGTFPKVENVGSKNHAILNFTLPSGSGEGALIAVDEELSNVSINPVQNKVITAKVDEIENELKGKSPLTHVHRKSDITDFPTLSAVAISGDFNDLKNKPESYEVDDELDLESPNPVQNAVVTSNINSLSSRIDSKASTYHTHTKNQIIDFPTSLPASDVSAWAKAPNKPEYTSNEISGLSNVARTGSYNDLTDKPDIGAVTSDDFLSTTSTNPVQNKVITSKVNQIETSVNNLSTQVGLKANKSEITSLDNSLSAVAKSGKYEDLIDAPKIGEVRYEDIIGTPVLSDVAISGKYEDLIGKIEKAKTISNEDEGYVTGKQLFNYATSMSLSTEEEVQAIIDNATATYSESLLNQQIDRINGENV